MIGAIYCDGGLGRPTSSSSACSATASATPAHERADAKTTLQEWAQGRGLEPPTYIEVERTGPDHAPEFTIEVNLGGYEPLRATGTSKKLAEHKAAEALPHPREGLEGNASDRRLRRTDTRCGFIALVGAPNAGKSTLLNSLVGTKVSIVTHKAQTTRAMIRGVVTKDQAQIVFIDTPGIFAPKRRLDRAMVDAAWTGAGDADFVALIVDAAEGA